MRVLGTFLPSKFNLLVGGRESGSTLYSDYVGVIFLYSLLLTPVSS